MIRIGTAGAPENYYTEGGKGSIGVPKWLRSKGLNAFEYQSGKGVRVSESLAARLAAQAAAHDVLLTLHAPYYINLATVEAEKKDRSKGYVLQALRAANLMKARRVVMHPGSAKPERKPALERASDLLLRILAEADEEGLLQSVELCPELMGKHNQLGSLEEILALCSLDERLIPCIDFGHLNSRTGGSLRRPDDYRQVCLQVADVLGSERMRRMHIHFSRIEYGKSGEIRHLTFANPLYGPYFKDFAGIIWELEMDPVIICESAGTQDIDALEMKEQLAAYAAGTEAAE
jgi:deoxyribonuclease-4